MFSISDRIQAFSYNSQPNTVMILKDCIVNAPQGRITRSEWQTVPTICSDDSASQNLRPKQLSMRSWVLQSISGAPKKTPLHKLSPRDASNPACCSTRSSGVIPCQCSILGLQRRLLRVPLFPRPYSYHLGSSETTTSLATPFVI